MVRARATRPGIFRARASTSGTRRVPSATRSVRAIRFARLEESSSRSHTPRINAQCDSLCSASFIRLSLGLAASRELQEQIAMSPACDAARSRISAYAIKLETIRKSFDNEWAFTLSILRDYTSKQIFDRCKYRVYQNVMLHSRQIIRWLISGEQTDWRKDRSHSLSALISSTADDTARRTQQCRTTENVSRIG
jgi:hypothetical protein